MAFLSPASALTNFQLVTSGDWNVAANWLPASVPSSQTNDNVYVADALGANLSVTLPAGVTATSRLVNIGNIGRGAMTISGGSLYAVQTTLGGSSGAAGTVSISGGTWSNDAAHELDLIVGNSGSGVIEQTGGEIRTYNASIGARAGSTGAVTVSGSSAQFISTDFLNVGDAGSGSFLLERGGQLTTWGTATLATGSTGIGTATVSGEGSKWTAGNIINVGYRGSGTLNITDGGQVLASYGTGAIGTLSGGNGTVVVTGENSKWETMNLNVGDGGMGRLDIEDGGTVVVSQNTVLGVTAGSMGTINLNSGGTLLVRTLFTKAGGYQLNFNGGTLRVANGDLTSSLAATLVGSSVTTIDTNGQTAILSGALSGAGGFEKVGAGILTLSGNNTYSGGTKLSEGTLQLRSFTALGASTNTLQIEDGVLDLYGQTVTVGAVVGGGTIRNDAAGTDAVLIVDAVADSTFGGAITNGGSARTVSFVKKGIGAVTFTGASDFTGNTMVSGGKLVIAGPSAGIASGATGNFYIGFDAADDGTLEVSNGAVVSGLNMSIGKAANSTGAVELTGGGSSISLSTLTVGESGAGRLDVVSGAELVSAASASIAENDGSAGLAIVNGTASRWEVGDILNVGKSGEGSLDVKDGGEVSIAGRMTLGTNISGKGTVVVSGTNSTLSTSGAINVGYSGSGTLNVSSGGAVTITGDPDDGAIFNIGQDGTGVVNVTAGGKLEGSATLGTNEGASGKAIVDGAGSSWTAKGINLGYLGSGQLDIQNGGVVVASQSVVLGLEAGSTGTLNLEVGGVLRTNGIYGGSGTAQLNFNGGAIQVYGGTLQSSLRATLGAGTMTTIDTNGFAASIDGVYSGSGGLIKTGDGRLTLSGKNVFSGPVIVDGGTLHINGDQSAATGALTVAVGGRLGGTGRIGGAVTVAGTLDPGVTTGTLTVGSLTLASTAIVDMQINGTAAGSFDRITSLGGAGSITLDGVLNLIFASAFTSNASIDLFLGPSQNVGDFSSVTISGGGYVAGDFQHSGQIWTSVQGDHTLIFDASTGVLTIAVPEPSTILLLALAVGLLGAAGLRRKAQFTR